MTEVPVNKMSAPINESYNVPIDDPNADTEWNDILRKHGVIPEKPPSPTTYIEDAIIQERCLAHENRLEGKDLDELDELEDLEDEDFLKKYRQNRIQEMKKIEKKCIHGSVYPITKPDYLREVTDASTITTVLVLLKSSNTESRVISELWPKAASKYGELKFCEIRAEMAIEGYPERNCPTILVYKNCQIIKQIVTLALLGGVNISMIDIESILLDVGALNNDDIRIKSKRKSQQDNLGEDNGRCVFNTGSRRN